ncbi:hypothetical protein [Polaribacter aquimarinus]|uniref:DUF4468 domain-containing protein n=1 Tax=Polaribacter aquimarinus TaxID=2100726 RepID=A0A2U2JCC9_9FLAO|nr:hypothetical protein [Polaribacter aquimarinus]PWG05998.1 hypothetical protein DIS07_06070 [Polaribacter aquimarinus]
MKKKICIILLIITNSICLAQNKPAKIILKTGDTISGVIGKFKTKSFKYKKYANGKSTEINFSKIKKLIIQYSKKERQTYHFFKLKESEKYVAVQKLILGKEVHLYGILNHFNSTGAGGISINTSSMQYFLKRANEMTLTNMGYYNPPFGKLKERTLDYFSDCSSLVEKIKKKEFRIRYGLEKIVIYYNNKCHK